MSLKFFIFLTTAPLLWQKTVFLIFLNYFSALDWADSWHKRPCSKEDQGKQVSVFIPHTTGLLIAFQYVEVYLSSKKKILSKCLCFGSNFLSHSLDIYISNLTLYSENIKSYIYL